MKNNSKIVFVLHWLRGMKMEATTSPYLRFSVGTSLLLAATGYFIHALAKSGLLSVFL